MKRLGVLVAVLGLVASACGGSTTDTETTEGESSETTAAGTEETTTEGDEAAAGDSPYGEDFDPALKADDNYQIGVALQQEKAAFWGSVKEGSVDAGVRAAVDEPFFADGNADSTIQENQIKNMIVEGYDGIVLGATNSEAAEAIVAETSEADIPVVAVALQVGDPAEYGANAVHPDTVGLVTNDDVSMGRVAAEFVVPIAEEKGEALNIVILEGTAGAANTELRGQGFQEGLDESGVEYEITNRQNGDFKREFAQNACQSMLAADDEIDLIYSQSDEMTIGCVVAMKDAGREIPIASIGGNEEGIALVADGSVLGTVCQKPATMGAVATQLLIRHLNGEELGTDPFFYATPAITKDNLDDCIPEW